MSTIQDRGERRAQSRQISHLTLSWNPVRLGLAPYSLSAIRELLSGYENDENAVLTRKGSSDPLQSVGKPARAGLGRIRADGGIRSGRCWSAYARCRQ